MKTETIETIADIGSKATTAGATASMIGAFLLNNMIGLIGVLIALAGYFTNAYYKRKADQRHAEEFAIRMEILKSGGNTDSGLRPIEGVE